jgi:hypothetical protein
VRKEYPKHGPEISSWTRNNDDDDDDDDDDDNNNKMDHGGT